LSGADLRLACLSHAVLGSANLFRANLFAADLVGAKLNDASLVGADLESAYLMNADLSGASLYNADLREAILTGADLKEANLSGADLSCAFLSEVLDLYIEQLSKVKTLYKAELDPELMEQVKDKYPHLLEKPEDYEEEPEEEEKLSKRKIITLRSAYKTLSESQVHSMPNVTIRVKEFWGFYGHSTINHDYSLKVIKGDKVVVDNATGLVWHQSGSDDQLFWDDAKERGQVS
jgi:hypothetical protein